jgi:sarcosine oxidase delta subunit
MSAPSVELLRAALRFVSAWGHVPGSGEWFAENQERVEDELRAAITAARVKAATAASVLKVDEPTPATCPGGGE